MRIACKNFLASAPGAVLLAASGKIVPNHGTGGMPFDRAALDRQ
jgi:hypothetical protein